MKDLVTRIAQALVDHPEEVTVTEVEGNQTSVLELKVAKEDLGKIIGKEGRNARAMRTILGAASAKLKKRTVLEILVHTARRTPIIGTIWWDCGCTRPERTDRTRIGSWVGWNPSSKPEATMFTWFGTANGKPWCRPWFGWWSGWTSRPERCA
jgi:uncharacterized protein